MQHPTKSLHLWRQTTEEVHGEREDDGGVLLRGDGVEGLEVSQLEGSGRLVQHVGCLLQGSGRVLLSFSRNHLDWKWDKNMLNSLKFVKITIKLSTFDTIMIRKTYRQMRARRVLMLFKDVPSRTRRGYRCTTSMVIAPFWFSTEHCWTALTPFLLSVDKLSIYGQYKYV